MKEDSDRIDEPLDVLIPAKIVRLSDVKRDQHMKVVRSLSREIGVFPEFERTNNNMTQSTDRDFVVAVMADAMLDPAIGKNALPSGNVVRAQVIERALAAAATLGWVLQPESST